MLKAHEVTILHTKMNGMNTKFSVNKYIVIARNTSTAVSLVPLKEGEEVLEAKELQNHQVILESE